MMAKIINEKALLNHIRQSENILLFEPPYRRKYIPLGLAKIASFHKGRKIFSREPMTGFKTIFVSTLFTYDSEKVLLSLKQLRVCNPDAVIIVGGILATLMPSLFPDDVLLFKGYSKQLDMQVPDYSINWQIESPWDDYSFTFTMRECVNRCPYCAVWKLEPDIWINPTWKDHIIDQKKYAMISDNNLSASPEGHFEEVAEYLSMKGKRTTFDNGFDCKWIDSEKSKWLSKIKYARHGCRLAFDRIEEDGVFQSAVKTIITAGVPKSELMAYVLFNFTDTPEEANYRMRECVKLGIRPYPQKYTPLMTKNRDNPYIGKHWNADLLKHFRHFWLMAGIYLKNDFFEWYERQSKNVKNSENVLQRDRSVLHQMVAKFN